MPPLTILRADIDSPEARELHALSAQEFAWRYPDDGPNGSPLLRADLAPGRGALLIARADGRAAGCGALRTLEGTTGELKRMFTRREWRGQGVGRALLRELECVARELGLRRLVLETGIRQPEAIALYERGGFERIPPYGGYADSAISLCLQKDL